MAANHVVCESFMSAGVQKCPFQKNDFVAFLAFQVSKNASGDSLAAYSWRRA